MPSFTLSFDPLAFAFAAKGTSSNGEGDSEGMNPSASEPEPLPDGSGLSGQTADLMSKIANGDREALGRFYDLCSRPMLATAFRILSDAAEAEDVVQDVFLTVWAKASEFDSQKGSAIGWVISLTRNRAIDRVRTRRRRQGILDAAPPGDLGYQTGIADDASNDAATKEQAAAIRRAVGELNAEQRIALELAFFSGLTQQEIAAKLNEPLGTVKARIRRALLKLRDHFVQRL